MVLKGYSLWLLAPPEGPRGPRGAGDLRPLRGGGPAGRQGGVKHWGRGGGLDWEGTRGLWSVWAGGIGNRGLRDGGGGGRGGGEVLLLLLVRGVAREQVAQQVGVVLDEVQVQPHEVVAGQRRLGARQTAGHQQRLQVRRWGAQQLRHAGAQGLRS